MINKNLYSICTLILCICFMSTPAYAAAAEQAWTIMIYVTGSDLESENGFATDDFIEIMDSNFDSTKINVIAEAGGTSEWQNDFISPSKNTRLKIEPDGITVLEELPISNMGKPSTLKNFIDFSINNFPAEKYSLILWNHGGGPLSGVCFVELQDSDYLSLSEINAALKSANLDKNKLELIAFDACLMASVEIASVVAPYAKYMVASEELVPGSGLDYNFLQALGKNPRIGGEGLGRSMVNSFDSYYALPENADKTTLSLINLSKIQNVISALEALLVQTGAPLKTESYKILARARSKSQIFGEDEHDIIDIASFAKNITENEFLAKAKNLEQSIKEAVVQRSVNRSMLPEANGLSMFFPFANKENVENSLTSYSKAGFSPKYTEFTNQFASILTGEIIANIFESLNPETSYEDGMFTISLSPDEADNIQDIYLSIWQCESEGSSNYYMLGEIGGVEIADDGTIVSEFDGYWYYLDDYIVCLEEQSYDSETDITICTVSAVHNGVDVDLYYAFSPQNPDGVLLGAKPWDDGNAYITSRSKLIPVKKGDNLQIIYYMENFDGDNSEDSDGFYTSEEFKIKNLKLSLEPVSDGEYVYGFWIVDLQQNNYYTDFISVEFES